MKTALLFVFVVVGCLGQLNDREEQNLESLQAYAGNLFTGNIDEALKQMTANVVFQFNGDKELLPFAGTYNGHDGVKKFFENGFKYFTNFTWTDYTYLAFNNYSIVATFLESATSLKTNERYSVINVVLYTFSEDNKIAKVDIYLDTSTVAKALLCNNSKLTCESEETSNAERGLSNFLWSIAAFGMSFFQ